MGKKIVLEEADYLELRVQATYWKTQFLRRRDRGSRLKKEISQGKKEIKDLQNRLKTLCQVHDQERRALVEKLAKIQAELEKEKSSSQGLRKMVFGSRSEKEKDEKPSGKPGAEGDKGRQRGKQGYKALENWGQRWVVRIGKLYRLHRQRHGAEKETKTYQKADKVLRAHVQAMESMARRELEIKNLHPYRKKVLASLMRHWEGLTLYVDNGCLPLNNEAERCLRNAVVGRKSYYGSGAEWSGELSAWLFSLFETLKKNKQNPMAYLTAYLQACARAGGEAPKDLSPFLPWNWQEQQERAA